MYLLASLAFAFAFDALQTANSTAETISVISVSVAGIIGAILAARKQAKPKASKPKPRQSGKPSTLSTDDLDEIGARR